MIVECQPWSEGTPATNPYRHVFERLLDHNTGSQVVSLVDWWNADRPVFGLITKEMIEIRKSTMLEF